MISIIFLIGIVSGFGDATYGELWTKPSEEAPAFPEIPPPNLSNENSKPPRVMRHVASLVNKIVLPESLQPSPTFSERLHAFRKHTEFSFARLQAMASPRQLRMLAALGASFLVVFAFFAIAIQLQKSVVLAAYREAENETPLIGQSNGPYRAVGVAGA